MIERILNVCVPTFGMLVFLMIGWYIVWKLFLQDYKFVYDLLGWKIPDRLMSPKRAKAKPIRRYKSVLQDHYLKNAAKRFSQQRSTYSTKCKKINNVSER